MPDISNPKDWSVVLSIMAASNPEAVASCDVMNVSKGPLAINASATGIGMTLFPFVDTVVGLWSVHADKAIEVALLGSENAIEVPGPESGLELRVAAGGSLAVMKAFGYRSLCEEDSRIAILHEHRQRAVLKQMALTTNFMAHRSIASRVARRLLLVRDLQNDDTIAMTIADHATALAVTALPVRLALASFHEAGAIDRGHGYCRIVDKELLKSFLDS